MYYRYNTFVLIKHVAYSIIFLIICIKCYETRVLRNQFVQQGTQILTNYIILRKM